MIMLTLPILLFLVVSMIVGDNVIGILFGDWQLYRLYSIFFYFFCPSLEKKSYTYSRKVQFSENHMTIQP